MALNFHYAAYSYLDEHLSIDKPLIDALSALDRKDATEKTVETARKLLVNFAQHYSVLRTLRIAAFEEPLRLQFVLEQLRSAQRPSEDALEEVVSKFLDNLFRKYKTSPLSAATKFLWARFQHPVVSMTQLRGSG